MLVNQKIISRFLKIMRLNNIFGRIIILRLLTNIELNNFISKNNDIRAFNKYGVEQSYL